VDNLFLLVALILVGLVGYMAYAKSQRDQWTFNSLYKPANADVPADEHDLETTGSITFSGDSDFISQNFLMSAGQYQLIYTFPPSVQVKVELYSKDGIDKEIIAIKSGEGEVGFSVESSGRYFCQIEPAKDGEWEIEIRRVGQPALSG
jgi:hypothetical protein